MLLNPAGEGSSRLVEQKRGFRREKTAHRLKNAI